MRLASALAQNIGAGKGLAIKGAAAEMGSPEDVAKAMMDGLYEVAKEKLLQDTGITQQVEVARAQAIDAAQQAAGGFFRRLFGRKG